MGNLPLADFWIALTGFSFGVELGHQAVVLPLFLVLLAARSLEAHGWGAVTPVLVRALSLAVTAGGVYFLAYTL
jgi:hypothetical protein